MGCQHGVTDVVKHNLNNLTEEVRIPLLSPTQQHQLVLFPTQGVALDIVISDKLFCLLLKRGYNFKGAETEDNTSGF